MKTILLALIFQALQIIPSEPFIVPAEFSHGDLDLAFGNDSLPYSNRILFLQPLNNNGGNCASNNRCCRYRCPNSVQNMCSPAATAMIQCAVSAAPPVAPVARGYPCIIDNNCAECFTDRTIACAGMNECYSIPGSDVCPWI